MVGVGMYHSMEEEVGSYFDGNSSYRPKREHKDYLVVNPLPFNNCCAV
jgi:hypothetical protein